MYKQMNKQTRRNNLGKSLSRRKSKGFTLIELMMTITLFGIILAYAAPGFVATQTRAEVRELSDNIENALNLARTGAITRGEEVVMCPMQDANREPATYLADDICDAGDWDVLFSKGSSALNTGFIVFADGDGDGKVGSINNLIKIVKTTASRNVSIYSSNQNIFRFGRKGGSVTNGTVVVGAANHLKGSLIRAVVVSPSGKIKNITK